MCNGPFYLHRWNFGISLTLRKNDDYKGASPAKPAGVNLLIDSDPASRLEKIKSGSYDAAVIHPLYLPELEQNKNVTLYSYTDSVLALNFNLADKYLKNADIRRAIVMSADESVILGAAGYTRAQGLVPETCVLAGEPYRSAVSGAKSLPQDNAAAKELFGKGLDEINRNLPENGKLQSLNFTLLCPEDGVLEDMLKNLLQRWQQTLGFRFNIGIEPLTLDELERRVRGGDYQMAVYAPPLRDDSAQSFFDMFTPSGSYNIWNLRSAEYKNITAGLDEAQGKKLAAKCGQAEQYLLENAVIMPLYQHKLHYAAGVNISGLVFRAHSGRVFFASGGKR